MNTLPMAGRASFHENTLDYDAIWQWSSGIEAGTADKQPGSSSIHLFSKLAI